MKKTISVLDQTTIDKIAAGEVVERPASVVKELVENAIDAGASAVTVEIKEGGTTFIRITDNGSGIEKSQVPLAFLRHATSKIRDVDDLLRISSLGFRGEALSSIAAVSQVELISKPHDQLIGVRYLIEGGAEKGLEEIGAPDGTTFLIRNLFFNTPARAKFLKTPATEAGYISSFIEQLALSHPHISFKYMQNGQTKLHTSGNDNLKEVIYQVYGRDITRELIEIDYSDPSGDFQIRGFIGKPTVSRGNRNFENYYVNGRYVKSKIIMKAIEDAYHTFMMQHKYPFTSLYITIKGEDVDINVHPTKMEVRFSKQEYVYRQIYQTVLEGLQRKELIPEVTLDNPGKRSGANDSKQEKNGMRAPEPFEYRRRQLEQKTQGTNPVSRTPEKHSIAYSGDKSGMLVRENPSYQMGRTTEKEFAGNSLDHRPNQSVSLQTPQKPVDTSDRAYKKAEISSEASAAKPKEVLPKAETSAQVSAPVQHTPDTKPKTLHVPEAEKTPNTHTVATAVVTEPQSAKSHDKEECAKANASEAPEFPEAPSTPTVTEIPEIQESTQMELFDGKLLSQEAKKHHKIVGQIFDTYWLVQMEDKLYIIDQHAAHEKVLYERIVREMKERQVTSQLLSPPLIISLNLQEQDKMKRYKDVFSSMGFEIESFGGRDYSIRAVPQNLFGLTREEFFIEILDHLEDDPSSKTLEVLSDRMATMACKAAVKGNQHLSATEAIALIDELLELENPYNCPHGRPTIISMTKYELEKKFKRIV